MKTLKRYFWLFMPDSPKKRARCGGYWTNYSHGVIGPVWQQTADAPPDRFPCQFGGQLREYHGLVKIKTYA